MCFRLLLLLPLEPDLVVFVFVALPVGELIVAAAAARRTEAGEEEEDEEGEKEGEKE